MHRKWLAAFVAASVPHAGAQEAKKTDEVRRIEKVTVTATPLGRAETELAQPATVLDEDALRRKRAASLGDTLAGEPGVQSSAFGAGAGRPVIRGLDGPRVRVLENGIGTLDASSVSPDHAVASESLRADQVEILRGPASLLYGSGAIGGIVNVVSSLVPREPARGLAGNVEMRGATANRERTGSFALNGGEGGLAFHLDGFARRTRDYEIPGFAFREGFEPHHEHGEGEGHDHGENPRGRLPNSDVRSRGAGAGASWVGSRGHLGAGGSVLRNDYGVPSGEGTRIRLRQERFEASSELSRPLPGFDRLRARVARNDYRHDEIESGGEVGTTFVNKGHEGRLELRHGGLLAGTLGVQVQSQRLSALGEEAILPRTRSRAQAAFIVEEKDFGAWVLDAGVRVERERREPDGELPSRRFSLASPAIGIVWKLAPGYRLALAATQAQRAPSAEELYSNGAHHATATFDIGDPGLAKEVSRNVDLSLRRVEGDLRWRVNVFSNSVRDYVFAASQDADNDGTADRVDEGGALDPAGEFLVQRYAQGRARFRGAEVELAWRPAGRPFGLRLFGDTIRARLSGGPNLPRIAPSRVGASLDWRTGGFTTHLTLLRGFEQRRVAPLESSTPAYTRVDAEVAYRWEGSGTTWIAFLQGSNLGDEEIRVHTSYLKNVAPQMGRSFTLGVRAEF